MVSKISVHSHLSLLIWAYNKAEHHRKEYMLEQTCSLHGGQKVEKEIDMREKKREYVLGQDVPFHSMSL